MAKQTRHLSYECEVPECDITLTSEYNVEGTDELEDNIVTELPCMNPSCSGNLQLVSNEVTGGSIHYESNDEVSESND